MLVRPNPEHKPSILGLLSQNQLKFDEIDWPYTKRFSSFNPSSLRLCSQLGNLLHFSLRRESSGEQILTKVKETCSHCGVTPHGEESRVAQKSKIVFFGGCCVLSLKKEQEKICGIRAIKQLVDRTDSYRLHLKVA